jgi:transposase-like protein
MSDLSKPHFQDANKAREYLEALRWPNGPVCPHCAVQGEHYQLQGKAHRPGLWKCKDCREQFSVTVGTVFERSKIALNKWLLAVHLMCASKKGISSHQLHRMLGVTYKTAWFMTHRIREAMKSEGGLMGGSGGAVEVDETYWGTQSGHKKKQGYGHKIKVLSLVERDGVKRSFHIANVNAKTLRPILKAQIAAQARLMTDEAAVYKTVGREFAEHGVVVHSACEYSRDDVTTNTVESSFALLKRGLIGTFHKVSEAHIQRYATEFDFRWNHRKVTDTERTDAALKGIQGKRLTYRTASPLPTLWFSPSY